MAKSKIFRTARTSLSVGTSIYASGDALGAAVSFNVPTDGTIKAIIMLDKDDETAIDCAYNFFDSQPSTIAANAVYTPTDADTELFIGAHFQDGSAVQQNWNNSRVYTNVDVNIPYHIPAGILWMQAELQANTPTFADTDDVQVMIVIEHE